VSICGEIENVKGEIDTLEDLLKNEPKDGWNACSNIAMMVKDSIRSAKKRLKELEAVK
tara:strand:- start:915 stop:1088 length:174 start_codon:yes stop_codon:yes gene_type:complete